ncbi:MAG: GGDEF domain-containing protein [Solirubrobacteraceae bacterium]|nr:GGDEF domain-containing protein [Solirubrobacteraceae bacterium]
MAPPATSFRRSWFCRDELEHQRFMDMNARLMPVNTKVMALVMVCVIPALFFGGDIRSVGPAVFGVIFFGGLQRAALRLPNPQFLCFVGLIGATTCIVIALYFYDAADSAGMALVSWPVAGIAGRYARRVLVVGTAYTCIIAAGAIMLAVPGILTTDPLHVTLIVAAIIASASVGAVLRDSDIDNRGAAILDPLTGMLNRNALNGRIPEIEEQSRLAGNPVGVIVADLDHFKSVNDNHGHGTGDAVLRDVAYVLRRELRAYDLAYRLGGEEFAVLLPGAGLKETAAMAERLRAAVAADQIEGLDIRVSVGATATGAGEQFVWKTMFERADAALYRAKDAGRDCVVVEGLQPVDHTAAEPAAA